MAHKLKLKKFFQCGLCDWNTTNGIDLENHLEANHICNACGKAYIEKGFHRCVVEATDDAYQVGYGSTGIQIPVDADNNPVF